MNRRTIITLILLLLLLLLLVAEGVMKPPKVIEEKLPKGRELLVLEDTRTPLDEGLAEVPETEAEMSPEEPKPIIVVLNHSGWLNDGYYEVFGELQNTGKLSGRNVSLHVFFKDINFGTLAEVKGPANRTMLVPNEKTSFKIVLKDKTKSAYVGSYVILTQVAR